MKYKNQNILSRLINGVILLTFLTGQILTPSIVSAQVLPALGTMLGLSTAYAPPVLLGLKVHPENPLLFDFIVDRGQNHLSDEEFKVETEKLVKYFFAALTIPDKEVWVNLSPYEKDRIIPDILGKTQMGKTMLEQDYMLKQLAASLTNPEKALGKTYWDQVHRVETLDGGRSTLEKIANPKPLAPSPLNKVWIVPAKAKVLESNGIVVVDEKRLKVMMAEDVEKTSTFSNPLFKKEGETRDISITPSLVKEVEGGVSTINISSDIFRETILPDIEKEVNEGKDFAAVRQVYNSVILAAWYKQALKESLLGRVYADQAKVAGVAIDDTDMKGRVYAQYLEAFKKGAYNFIKEEEDASGELIPRKYFSGGIEVAKFGQVAGSALEIQIVSYAAVEQPILRASASIVTVQGEELASAAVIEGNLPIQSLPNELEPELAASSALSDYLLPVEDGSTRDAVKVLARKLFALSEVIGVPEIESFRILWEQTDVNSLIGDRLRVLNTPGQNLKTRAIAETLIAMQNDYSTLFATSEQVDEIMQAFWVYSLNFESLEELMRKEDSIISSRPLAVRQIISLLVLNENYLAFVFDYAERLRKYQNLQEVPLRINEYLDEERDSFPAMTSTIENIRLGLSAEFLDSRDLDGFADIMHDVSVLLKSLMVEQAKYMISRSGDKHSASSGGNERPRASSALSEYLLPIEDLNIRGAVKTMAKKFFASSDQFTDIEFQNFRLAVSWSSANDNPDSLARDLITPLLFDRNSPNAKIAKIVMDVYQLQPFILASKESLLTILEGFENYAKHFQEIERYQIGNDRFRVSHSLVVRAMANQVIVNDIDLADFGKLAELLIDASQNVDNIYGIDEGKDRSVFNSLEQARLKAQDDNSQFIFDIIDESLSADLKRSEERGEFVSILKDVQQFLRAKMMEAGTLQKPDSVGSSSAITPEQINDATNRVMGTLQQTKGFWDGILQSSVGAEAGLSKLIKVLLTKALPNSNITNPTVAQINQWITEAGIVGDLKNGFSTAEASLSTQGIMAQYLGYQFENNSVRVVPQIILQEIAGLAKSASSTVSSTAPTASSAAVGGINFDPTLLNLQIKRDGRGVPLPLPQQNIENINIEGLFPVIINIQPVNAQTLPLFLGQSLEQPKNPLELTLRSSR